MIPFNIIIGRVFIVAPGSLNPPGSNRKNALELRMVFNGKKQH